MYIYIYIYTLKRIKQKLAPMGPMGPSGSHGRARGRRAGPATPKCFLGVYFS